MKCENCGTIIDDNSKFCYNCGHQIGTKVVSSTPANPVQKIENKKSKTSPFSVIFAVGLTIAALIFFNKIYRDLGEAMRDRTSEITMRTVFVLPVVVIAFVLFFSLYRKDSKYRVGLIPYFITALWLLLRLLIEMGVFFYERYQEATVYVSMILVMFTLTALIFYIQRAHDSKS